MDIATLSIVINQSKIHTEASIAVTKTTMDTGEESRKIKNRITRK